MSEVLHPCRYSLVDDATLGEIFTHILLELQGFRADAPSLKLATKSRLGTARLASTGHRGTSGLMGDHREVPFASAAAAAARSVHLH
jgi:hypothetical protein